MMKIGELSNITGISIQTIRFYESEGLIKPVEVDRWTNYRYYDESSIVRISEISFLKDLGFSLKEIKNLDEKTIKEKISQTKKDIRKLTKNIKKLSTLRKEQGGFFMKNFVNDEKVIGKWEKVAVVKTKEDFENGLEDDYNIFPFDELYFLPEGQEYWVFGWTKGALFLKDRKLPYEIVGDKLFIGVVDPKSNEIDNYAVYTKVSDRHFNIDEISRKDNLEFDFVKDKEVVGFWEVFDFIDDPEKFDPTRKEDDEDNYLERLSFDPSGILYMIYDGGKKKDIKWTNGLVLDKYRATASKYVIKHIDNEDYLIMEWKSGDYTFEGKIYGYYVFKKIK